MIATTIRSSMSVKPFCFFMDRIRDFIDSP
jgi:hypothetical protein